MEHTPTYYRHYITTDEAGRVLSGWSDGPHPLRDTANAVCIEEKGGYHFRLSPDGEENPCLYDWNGMIPRYRWDGTQVVKRSEEEILADRAALPEQKTTPSQEERIAELEESLDLLLSGVTE